MLRNRKYILTVFCLMALISATAAMSAVLAASAGLNTKETNMSFAKNGPTGQTINFSKNDFSQDDEDLTGIIIESLPDKNSGVLTFSGEEVSEGSIVSASAMGSLSFIPSSEGEVHTFFSFKPVFGSEKSGNISSASINLSEKENINPIAINAEYEIYRDMQLCGSLEAFDPEGGQCSFTADSLPRRGTLSFTDTGFIYTPSDTRASTDSFTFTATDPYGGKSEPATVTISILDRDPEDAVRYSDMSANDAHFAAVRLAEEGILRGESIGSQSLLYPDKTVTRAEFTAMAADAASLPLPTAAVSTGMGDNEDIPAWARASVAAALECGVVSGEKTSNGNMAFRANDCVTKAEAAVIVQRLLSLPLDGRTLDCSDSQSIPSWAEKAAAAAVNCGYLELESDGSFSPGKALTRAETAKCLYNVMESISQKDKGFFNIFD